MQLDVLLGALDGLHRTAIGINETLVDQAPLLEHLEKQMDETTFRMEAGTARVKKVIAKA